MIAIQEKTEWNKSGAEYWANVGASLLCLSPVDIGWMLSSDSPVLCERIEVDTVQQAMEITETIIDDNWERFEK